MGISIKFMPIAADSFTTTVNLILWYVLRYVLRYVAAYQGIPRYSFFRRYPTLVLTACRFYFMTRNAFRYRKVPKFSDARKCCCNLPKIQTKRPNLRVFRQKGANAIAHSEDPDQTAECSSARRAV